MKVGIIGYGYIGKLHHIKLKELGIDEIYVYDINYENLKYAEKNGAKIVNTLEEFRRCDKVIVATPTDTHYDVLKKIIYFNLDILCEKPCCKNIKEYLKIYKLASNKENSFFIGYTEFFNPIIDRIKKIVDKLKIYAIEFIRIGPKPTDRYLDPSPIRDLIPHDLAVMDKLFGLENFKREFWIENRNQYDYGKLILRGNFIVDMTAGRLQTIKKREIKIYTDRFTLIGDTISQRIRIYENVDYVIENDTWKDISARYDLLIIKEEPLKIELKEFLYNTSNYNFLELGLKIWKILDFL